MTWIRWDIHPSAANRFVWEVEFTTSAGDYHKVVINEPMVMAFEERSRDIRSIVGSDSAIYILPNCLKVLSEEGNIYKLRTTPRIIRDMEEYTRDNVINRPHSFRHHGSFSVDDIVTPIPIPDGRIYNSNINSSSNNNSNNYNSNNYNSNNNNNSNISSGLNPLLVSPNDDDALMESIEEGNIVALLDPIHTDQRIVKRKANATRNTPGWEYLTMHRKNPLTRQPLNPDILELRRAVVAPSVNMNGGRRSRRHKRSMRKRQRSKRRL